MVKLPRAARTEDVQQRALTNALILLIGLAVLLALFNRGSTAPTSGFAVVRKSPPPNTFDGALTSWIWLEFDRAVNHESVEKNLKINPPTKGRFAWHGDSLVAFVPETTLTPDLPYTVTLGPAAANTRGLNLGKTVVWRFRTIPKGRFELAEPLNPQIHMTQVYLSGQQLVRLEAGERYVLYKVEFPLTPEKVFAMELHFLTIRPGIENQALELLNQYNRRQMTRPELVEGLNKEVRSVAGTIMDFTGLSYGPELAESFGTVADGVMTYLNFLRALRDFVRMDAPDVFKRKLVNIEWRDPTLFARYMRDVKDPLSFVGVAPGFISNLVTGEIQYGVEVLDTHLKDLGISVYGPQG